MPNLIGEYRLTFTAASACSLPSEAMKLTFAKAWVSEPAPGSVTVGLYTNFPCWDCNPGFTGTRQGNSLSFVLIGAEPDTGAVEWLGDGREVRYDGTATATLGDKNIAGIFSGRISVVEISSGATLAACDAGDHKMDFVQ
jgi:hypothetical protein